jgi:cell division protein FtsW
VRVAVEARPRTDVDRVLAAAILSLVAFGLVMIYSASHVLAEKVYGSGTYFLSRQLLFAVLGVGVMIGVSYVPYRIYRTLTYPILIGALAGLVAVVAGLGVTIRHATRWIPVGPFNVEPSELAKIALVVWLSYSVAKKQELVRSFTIGFLPHALMAVLMASFCLLQPDFGSAAIFAAVTLAMLFVSGARLGHLAAVFVLAGSALAVAVLASAYRLQRVLTFLDPWRDRLGKGYQSVQSQIGFGGGGLLGQGIGSGRQKLHFLPDPHNDFIAAIVGEELGLVGVLALLGVVALVVVRGYRIALRCRDAFGGYLAFGLTTLIGLQAAINVGVAMGALPTKGLTLPFVSYGGSSLLVHMAAAGILLNISRHGAGGEAGR